MKIKLFLFFLSIAGSSWGQVSENAASKMMQQINALMSDYTDTLVTPTARPDAVIIISMKSLQNEKVSKMWTFISACAVGKYLTDNPTLGLDEIWFADVTGMKARPARYFVLSSIVAKSVQSKVSSGELEIEAGQAIIQSKLVRKTKDIK